MKVKTDYEGSKNFTAGKEYSIIETKGDTAFYIRDDFGKKRFCLLYGCSHLKSNDWIIVDETTEVADVTEQFKTETISLRDHFAGLAVQGIVANIPRGVFKEGVYSTLKSGAELAYEFADAMLEARNK